MIECVMLDLDDTILDFHKAEAIAISKTIGDFGVEPTQEVLDLYHDINRWHWQQLELGKMTRDQVLVNRFGALFSQLGLRDIIFSPALRKPWTGSRANTGCFWPATARPGCSTAA